MAIVIGVRHGEVHNPDHVVYARLPGFRLSEGGKAAAEALAADLADRPISAIWASPLERAVQTAELLAAPHGLTIRTDERLLEWSFWTRWAGVPWAEVRDKAPELFARYADDPESLHPDDPLSSVGGRVLEWAREQEEEPGVVLGVSHEAPLAAALLVGSGAPLTGFAAAHVPHLGRVRLGPGPTALLEPGVNGEDDGGE